MGRVKWRNKVKIEEDRKVSDGQPASKHGDKSQKIGCNDEQGNDKKILKKSRLPLSQKSNR